MVRNEVQEWYNFAFRGITALERFFPLFPSGLEIVERTHSEMRRWAREVAHISFRDLRRAEEALGVYWLIQIVHKPVDGRQRKVWRFFPLRLHREASRVMNLPETLSPEEAERELKRMMQVLEDSAIVLSGPDVADEESEALLVPTGTLAASWYFGIVHGLRQHRAGGEED